MLARSLMVTYRDARLDAGLEPEVFMPVFVCKLIHKDLSHRLIATCTVVGEEHGYETHSREFENAAHATKALYEAGIGKDRCGSIPEDASPDWSCTFEISHNEAQKLDVLHVDSTE